MPTDADQQSQPIPIGHRREPFLPLTLAVLAAPLLWALHFAILYLLEGFLCNWASSGSAIAGTIVVVTLICGGGCVWLLAAGDAWLRFAGSAQVESHNFLKIVQRLLTWLALAAILGAAWG